MKYTDPNGEFVLGFVGGFIRGLYLEINPWKLGWVTGINELKIYGGLFKTDPNKSFWGQVWEVASRVTWQLLQTAVGLVYNVVSNIAWQIDKVEYWGGATVTSGNFWGQGGAITLSNYINGDYFLKADPNTRLFQHEYGHYLQSQEYGLWYIPRIGIPSLRSAMKSEKGEHSYFWTEQDANARAFLYFNENIEGFYKSLEEKNDLSRGWNFSFNPLNLLGSANSSSTTYCDYRNPEDVRLLNLLIKK